jgi:hypothetical protein
VSTLAALGNSISGWWDNERALPYLEVGLLEFKNDYDSHGTATARTWSIR